MEACGSFILAGVARSGTTSLARILDQASNGCCMVEPSPNLNVATRLMMEGRLEDPRRELSRTVVGRLKAHLAQPQGIYGEKDVTYAPFIRMIYEETGCRFVFCYRDGRDVVRSLINWHDKKFGSVYRECAEAGDLNSAAISAAANLLIGLDTSDYSRPRPPEDSPAYIEWESWSRPEMCAYYWSTVNELYLKELGRLPPSAWISIDYTAPSVEAVLQVARFVGLEGLEGEAVQGALDRRINSLQDRGEKAERVYPKWTDWDGGLRRRFDQRASVAMASLGLYRNESERWKPPSYGKVWSQEMANHAWYEWMYNGRKAMHDDMLAWIHTLEDTPDRINSVIDFGCGRAVGYSTSLQNKRYLGVDISKENIAWCQQNRDTSRHAYICADVIVDELPEKADLVFSSGTIDNAYDIDQYLAAMVRNSRKWIYLTCYRGWFPNIPEHLYRYDENHGCFYNDASLPRIMEQLEKLGCCVVSAVPLKTGNRDIPFETRIVAKLLPREVSL
jgi:hypothetical protein